MFVIVYPPKAQLYAAAFGDLAVAPQQEYRPSVWWCKRAEWVHGAMVLTDGRPELGDPKVHVPTMIIVPVPGSVIEVKP